MTIIARRSALYLPASNAKAIAKARTLDCDVVILDLEDAVAADVKHLAREQAVAALAEGGFGRRELIVRVNGLQTEWGEADLRAIGPAGADAILVPKVSTAEDIVRYATLLEGHDVDLWAMIETPLALFRLESIAATAESTRLRAFVMGTNDLARETGATLDTMRTAFTCALGLAVAAARAHGLSILDGVYNHLDDEAGFEAQARQAVLFGFDGKTLVHPRQIAICHRAFTPDDAEIARAQHIIAAFDAPENQAKGAIQVDGQMVERLHLEGARRTLAMAALPTA